VHASWLTGTAKISINSNLVTVWIGAKNVTHPKVLIKLLWRERSRLVRLADPQLDKSLRRSFGNFVARILAAFSKVYAFSAVRHTVRVGADGVEEYQEEVGSW
jgi:aromatic ring-opening dioxygenase LigB subunit